MKTLMGFDFIEYMKRKMFLGQVDPWRKTFDDKPIYTILVPLQTAYDECKNWSNQEFSITEFSNYLKLNDIYLFKNIDEFVKIKEEKEKKIKEEKKIKIKRNMSEEQKEKLRNRMIELNKTKKASIQRNPQ